MPIYAYRCTTCGHAKDVLRKISDPLLTHCPNCGAETFVKQVTAAGFKLKGTGWYVTDFRDHGAAPSKEGESRNHDAPIDVPHATQGAEGASAQGASPAASGSSDASNGSAAQGGVGASKGAPAAQPGGFDTKSAAAPASAPASGAAPGNK